MKGKRIVQSLYDKNMLQIRLALILLLTGIIHPAFGADHLAFTQLNQGLKNQISAKDFAGVGYIDFEELIARKNEAGFGHLSDKEFEQVVYFCLCRQSAQSSRLIFLSNECLAGCIELNETIVTQLKSLDAGSLTKPAGWSGLAKFRMEKVLLSWPAARKEDEIRKEILGDIRRLVDLSNQKLLQCMTEKISAHDLQLLKNKLQEAINDKAKELRLKENSAEHRLVATMSETASKYARQNELNYILVDEYSAVSAEDMSGQMQSLLHTKQVKEASPQAGPNPYKLGVVNTAYLNQLMTDMEVPEAEKLPKLRKICQCLLLKYRLNAIVSIYAVIAGAEDMTEEAVEMLTAKF